MSTGIERQTIGKWSEEHGQTAHSCPIASQAHQPLVTRPLQVGRCRVGGLLRQVFSLSTQNPCLCHLPELLYPLQILLASCRGSRPSIQWHSESLSRCILTSWWKPDKLHTCDTWCLQTAATTRRQGTPATNLIRAKPTLTRLLHLRTVADQHPQAL